MIYGRILGSVKLHSWVTTLRQQGTEVQDGRSSTLGCTCRCVHFRGAQTSYGQITKTSNKDALDQELQLQVGQHHHQAGTKLRWINRDSAAHTVTANNGRSFDSGRLGKGQSYTHTFKSVGKKPYHCEIHPFMRGSVLVKR